MTFDEWWEKESGRDEGNLSEYHLAKAAWNKAIQLAADQLEETERWDFNLREDFTS